MAERQASGRRSGIVTAALRGRTIGFLGAGMMGQALIKGLLAQGVAPRGLLAADASATVRARLRRTFRVEIAASNSELVRRSDIMVLAVKPQQVSDVVAPLAPRMTRRHLVISIAAGIPIAWLEQRLPKVPVIRVMPNLPATVGEGFSAVTGGAAATRQHLAIAQAIFGAVGDVVVLPERYFDAVTALSGSGPAYVFFFIQALEEAARTLGLPDAVAALAVRRTVRGSLALLDAGGEDPAALMAQVASKGGTTEAALSVLRVRRVRRHLAEAVAAAARRSEALALS